MSSFEGKVIKCSAAVAWKSSAPLVIEEVEVSPPKAGEVRFKVVSTGLCHSDWHMLAGKHSAYQFPTILGHEGAGIVESVGPGVTSFEPGDHVIPLYAAQCRECKYCKRPETNFCDKIKATQGKGLMPDGTPRFSCRGQPIYHYMGCSTFSEYSVVSQISLCKIDKKAPLEKVCLLGCAIPTGLGAVINTAQVQPGTTVAIWGLGGIGLSAAMGAKRAGAKRIIGVDINPSKFELGKKFGCTEFVNPKDYARPVQEVLIEMTDGGVDYAIECCGTVQTMRAAFEACHKGWGVAVAIGLVQAGHEVSFVPYALCEGRTWKGSSFGGWKGLDAVPKMVEWYMNGEIMVDEFINEYITLDKINEGFERMLKGESIRTIIIF